MAELNLSATTHESGEFPWASLLGLAPHLLWILALLGFLAWIGRDEIITALRRMNKIGVAGVELGFRDDIAAATDAHGLTATPGALDRASRRLAANAAVVNGARILWVDDEPANNAIEVRIFETAGARVILAVSTAEADRELARSRFDLVISDIARGGQPDAGLKMADDLRRRRVDTPVIFYVGHAQKPVPGAAFGISDRPDELIHLVVDALARQRG
jgi:CheY-like chemotaxis protein